jgi:hypothetical protein
MRGHVSLVVNNANISSDRLGLTLFWLEARPATRRHAVARVQARRRRNPQCLRDARPMPSELRLASALSVDGTPDAEYEFSFGPRLRGAAGRRMRHGCVVVFDSGVGTRSECRRAGTGARC